DFGVHLSRLASPPGRGGVPLLCFTLHRAPGRPRKGALAIPSRVTAHSGFGARDTHPRFFCGVSTNALACTSLLSSSNCSLPTGQGGCCACLRCSRPRRPGSWFPLAFAL